MVKNHWEAVKRIVRNLCGTMDHGLFLHRSSSLDLHASSDADWTGNKDDRTSTSGNIVFLALKSNVLLLDLRQKLSIVL